MSRQRGFTLVELLVAVTMLGVLMVLLFSAMRTGMRSWQAAEAHIANSEATVQAERFLVRIVSQASPGRGAGGSNYWSELDQRSRNTRMGASSGARFEGSDSRFLVVSPGVAALPRPGLYRYEVFLGERDGGDAAGDLWVRMDPYRGEDTEAGEARLLQENVAAFEVRYFGTAQPGEEPAWHDEWPSSTGRIPLLVAIRLQPADAPERPLIIAAPMVVATEGA